MDREGRLLAYKLEVCRRTSVVDSAKSKGVEVTEPAYVYRGP